MPIHYTADEETLVNLAKSVNGILLPGGGVSLSNSSVYYQAGKTLYDAAVKFNTAGEKFPIWGTCLGEISSPRSAASQSVMMGARWASKGAAGLYAQDSRSSLGSSPTRTTRRCPRTRARHGLTPRTTRCRWWPRRRCHTRGCSAARRPP